MISNKPKNKTKKNEMFQWNMQKPAYIVTEEKPRDLDAITTNLALSDLISNALPDIKTKDATNNKTGLMTIGENVGIFFKSWTNEFQLKKNLKKTKLKGKNRKQNNQTKIFLALLTFITYYHYHHIPSLILVV